MSALRYRVGYSQPITSPHFHDKRSQTSMLVHQHLTRICASYIRFNGKLGAPAALSSNPKVSSPLGRLMITATLFVGVSVGMTGCDTGFGEPCTLPEVDAIQEACSAPSVANSDENGTSQSASATCALDNFPGCQTFLCLKYRGAQPYCSLKCQTSNECSGGVCCPLLGDCRGNSGGNNNGANDMISDPAQQMSVEPSDPCADGSAECYCIRQVDLQR